jgi:putrescine transport system ATP-binding protein
MAIAASGAPALPGRSRAEPFLRIQSVVKKFGEAVAVDGVSLDIDKGEIFALLGSSGCGKSTLLRMLAGFESPTSGQIMLQGTDLTRLQPNERPVNMMFQSYALFPHLTVWDNVAFGLRRDKLPKAEVEEQVEKMLSLVQLKPYAKRKPHQLSGGQQQRVALARSLAKRPQLLLLDEPLGALDKKLRERTQLELAGIIRQVGVTCVMVTHDQEEAMTMATRIGVMSEGQILQVGRPGDIYETPNCRFVADFIGSVNLFKGNVTVDEPDHVVIDSPECRHYVSHGITGTSGMEVNVAIRPEKIGIQKDAPVADDYDNSAEVGFNCVRGEIRSLAYLGSQTIYHVGLASGLMVKVTKANDARHDESRLAVGDAVHVWWWGSDVVVLTQ